MKATPLSPALSPSEPARSRVVALVSLREARLRPVEEVGAKALHLSVAMALGHAVPAGIVLPLAALESGIGEARAGRRGSRLWDACSPPASHPPRAIRPLERPERGRERCHRGFTIHAGNFRRPVLHIR
jgi:hypothetical protein